MRETLNVHHCGQVIGLANQVSTDRVWFGLACLVLTNYNRSYLKKARVQRLKHCEYNSQDDDNSPRRVDNVNNIWKISKVGNLS